MARVAWTARLRPETIEAPVFAAEVAEQGLIDPPEVFRHD